ncbi:hypothetical protein OG625_37165 [Streptomyces sp. NBC_01351]|uniref:hypothetical protein n=1 Tax=Streptomyces sp. NBC_01351 TaxID=2903833 RepID=UPI002E326576|nr:hypothetical protein [Streptomyces sp. NBC_01351]
MTTAIGRFAHPLARDWAGALHACCWEPAPQARGLQLVDEGTVRELRVLPGHLAASVAELPGIEYEASISVPFHGMADPQLLLHEALAPVDRTDPPSEQIRHWLADARLRAWLRPTPADLMRNHCSCSKREMTCLHVLALIFAFIARIDADPREGLIVRGIDERLWPDHLQEPPGPVASLPNVSVHHHDAEHSGEPVLSQDGTAAETTNAPPGAGPQSEPTPLAVTTLSVPRAETRLLTGTALAAHVPDAEQRLNAAARAAERLLSGEANMTEWH